MESTRQYETQRAANERLLEEKESLNNNLLKLREDKAAVEQRLRNVSQDLATCKVLCCEPLLQFLPPRPIASLLPL